MKAEDIPLPEGLRVDWDRAAVTEQIVTVYGWIARSDGQRDFLLVDLRREDGTISWWCTSSAKWSAEISLLFDGEDGHTPCSILVDGLALVKP